MVRLFPNSLTTIVFNLVCFSAKKLYINLARNEKADSCSIFFLGLLKNMWKVLLKRIEFLIEEKKFKERSLGILMVGRESDRI